MSKKYKNEEYLKTKGGTNNYKPTISLLEKIANLIKNLIQVMM